MIETVAKPMPIILARERERYVRFLNADGGTLEGHSGGIVSASFSPDGRYVATESWNSTAQVWDAASGKLLHTLEGSQV